MCSGEGPRLAQVKEHMVLFKEIGDRLHFGFLILLYVAAARM